MISVSTLNTATFEVYRPLLMSIARRMVRGTPEAEDLVQESFLQFYQTPGDEIRSPRALLYTILQRRCLNHLNSARVRHERAFDVVPEPALEADAPTFTLNRERLEPGEQSLFTCLGGFVGRFTRELVRSVCEGVVPDSEIDGALDPLVQKSLVQPLPAVDGEARFTLIETLRAYVQEKLASIGRSAFGSPERIRTRHAQSFLRLAEQASRPLREGRQVAGWLNRLEDAHSDLRAALRWEIEQLNAKPQPGWPARSGCPGTSTARGERGWRRSRRCSSWMDRCPPKCELEPFMGLPPLRATSRASPGSARSWRPPSSSGAR